MNDHDKDEELMELGHDAVPGYKPVFYAIFIGAWLYLGFLFYKYM